MKSLTYDYNHLPDDTPVTLGMFKAVLADFGENYVRPMVTQIVQEAMKQVIDHVDRRFDSFLEEYARRNLEIEEHFARIDGRLDRIEGRLGEVESAMATKADLGKLNHDLRDYIDVKVEIVRSELIVPIKKIDAKTDRLADMIHENRGLTDSQHRQIKKFST